MWKRFQHFFNSLNGLQVAGTWAVLGILYVILVNPKYQALVQARNQKKIYQMRLKQLDAENATLRLTAEQLRKKNDFIYEELARQQGMILANERVYVFVDSR